MVAGVAGLLLFPVAGTALSDSAGAPAPEDYLPELVLVPPGELTFADPDRPAAREERAEPRRVVFERPFLIGRFEITFEQWDYCHWAGGWRASPQRQGVGAWGPPRHRRELG